MYVKLEVSTTAMPNYSFTFLIRTSPYVVKFAIKNGYKKDTCLRGIALHAQNKTIILNQIVNIIGETYTTTYSMPTVGPTTS